MQLAIIVFPWEKIGCLVICFIAQWKEWLFPAHRTLVLASPLIATASPCPTWHSSLMPTYLRGRTAWQSGNHCVFLWILSLVVCTSFFLHIRWVLCIRRLVTWLQLSFCKIKIFQCITQDRLDEPQTLPVLLWLQHLIQLPVSFQLSNSFVSCFSFKKMFIIVPIFLPIFVCFSSGSFTRASCIIVTFVLHFVPIMLSNLSLLKSSWIRLFLLRKCYCPTF